MKKTEQRKKKILEFMKCEIATNGYPPTVREICKALDIKSTSTVHKDLSILAEQGFIKKDPSKTRALVVVDDNNSLENKTKEFIYAPPHNTSASSHEFKSEIAEIPLVGNISAGTPILAEENLEDFFPIPARYLGNGENFMLKVKGDSMIEVGILDGDFILVEQSSDAKNGDIVVAMIESFETEATVKTFYRENGRIRLQPENSSMKAMYFDNVKVIGHVKGVFRYFH